MRISSEQKIQKYSSVWDRSMGSGVKYVQFHTVLGFSRPRSPLSPSCPHAPAPAPLSPLGGRRLDGLYKGGMTRMWIVTCIRLLGGCNAPVGGSG